MSPSQVLALIQELQELLAQANSHVAGAAGTANVLAKYRPSQASPSWSLVDELVLIHTALKSAVAHIDGAIDCLGALMAAEQSPTPTTVQAVTNGHQPATATAS